MNGRLLLFILLIALLFPMRAFAASPLGDLEIYGGDRITVDPNVLIIFDNSSSMMCCYNTNCSFPVNCGTLADQRLYIAKNAINNLVSKTNGVKFGLMVFNDNAEGGRVIQGLTDNKVDITNSVNNITTTRPSGADAGSSLVSGGYTYTPLAESLAEAGRYFAGLPPWFNNSPSTYNSPILQECQKNYIILMTDGTPTGDDNLGSMLTDGIYENNVNIPAAGESGSYLDDVAKYLHEQDCRTDLGNGQFLYQTIDTHPVGFTLTNALLTQTAANSETVALTAYNTAQLEQGLLDVIATVQDENVNGVYTPPTIPRSPQNSSEAGDMAYMAFFKPNENGRWIGNLKAFKLVNGVLKDASDPPVTATDNNGNILDSAKSFWSSSADGLNVDLGGAGQLLADRTLSVNTNDTGARRVYTYTATAGISKLLLTHVNNTFDTTNDAVKIAFPSINDSVITSTLNGTYVDRSVDTTEANWRLGAIVHSEPLVKYYEDPNNNGQKDTNEPRSYIFVGANDGMLHVFNADDGTEAWAFVPPGQVSRLSLLTSDSEFDYFVDGSPVIETVKDTSSSGTFELLVFGERRGGNRYYALDVTNPDEPAWKYEIKDGSNYLLGHVDAALGQSWSKPQLKMLKSPAVTQPMEVLLLAGGYDPDRYDATGVDDSVDRGRAIYTVQADTGAVSNDNDDVLGLSVHAENWLDDSSPRKPYMKDSILDVTGFDVSGKGYMDRVYAGDLGGRLFAIRYYDNCAIEGGCFNGWEPRLLFDLSSSASTVGKKIMTKPEVALEVGKECAYFGTGDRENPTDQNADDAIYAVCNTWPDSWSQPLTTTDIEDVTDNYVQDADTLEWSYTKPTSEIGWYLKLTHSGEKLTSAPKLLNKILYFTTFTPGVPVDGDDCNPDYDYGTSRLYAVNYRTGEAAYNFKADDEWTEEDRSLTIGTSISGDPVLTTSGITTSLYYGAGGKFGKMDVETNPRLKRYYWRQVK